MSVALFCDNTTTVAYLRRSGGTFSATLNATAREILLWAENRRIRLLPQFIMGSSNVTADALSRPNQVIGSEWTLHQEVVDQLVHKWPAVIDLFATSLTARLPVYFSPASDPRAAGTDALLQSWDDLQAYAFPPIAIIRRVLLKLRSSKNCELTLIAPFWPQRDWFPGTGVRFPLLLSLVLWPRLRIPLPLLLGLKALQYRPYQTRERIAMGDYCVLCGQSRFTSTALLHIVRDGNGCLSPQGIARRRLRRPRSPSGSGRRYHALTSSLERHCQCPPPELVRRVVSLRQFFSERILLSTRC